MAAVKGAAPIIIRRKKKGGHGGHHGGMWKIAYADFVTAMMAFFLLMWLLGSVSQADLNGIADYFNQPLKVAMAGGSSSGQSNSVIVGGSEISLQSKQMRSGSTQREPDRDARIRYEAAERARLEVLKQKLESVIFDSEALRPFKNQILLDLTDEGLRIQVVDAQNRPMFDVGKTVLKDYSQAILVELARALNGVENRLSLSGHTDSSLYSSGNAGYSNWELSADRANAARRAMLAAGTQPNKILRVVGLADSVPFDAQDATSPSNRRISIVVMNRRSEEYVKTGGKTANAATENVTLPEPIPPIVPAVAPTN